MKYILLIYHDEQAFSRSTEDQRQKTYAEYRQLIEELKSSGKYLFGDQLQPTATAQSVRVRDGKQLITDGPFAETREQGGGFLMIQASDWDESSRIAAGIPSARTGTIEGRGVVAAQ